MNKKRQLCFGLMEGPNKPERRRVNGQTMWKIVVTRTVRTEQSRIELGGSAIVGASVDTCNWLNLPLAPTTPFPTEYHNQNRCMAGRGHGYFYLSKQIQLVRACERSVSGAENGAERAENRRERSGAVSGQNLPLKILLLSFITP